MREGVIVIYNLTLPSTPSPVSTHHIDCLSRSGETMFALIGVGVPALPVAAAQPAGLIVKFDSSGDLVVVRQP